MVKGFVYVFLRKDGAPLPTGCAGHVGWGFAIENGPNDLDAVCGATENFKGAFHVDPGGDIGFWWKRFNHEAEMLQEMARRNYDGVKMATVRGGNYEAAIAMARDTSMRGYDGLGNNCLDHAFAVLEAYGVKDLPWKQTHPSPNDWFAQFNGEYKNL